MIEPSDHFYRELGKSLFTAQSLEFILLTLFGSASLSKDDSQKKTRDILDVKSKHTLGKLINDAIKQLDLPEEFSAKLKTALEIRNWLVHHFFYDFGMAALSEKSQTVAIEKLIDSQEIISTLTSDVYYLSIANFENAGENPSDIKDQQHRAYENFSNLHDLIEEIDSYSMELTEESIKYANKFSIRNPDSDATLVRESFLLQKIANLTIIVKSLNEKIAKLEDSA